MNSESISPAAITGTVREVLHGIEVQDRFRWLEDQNSPGTRAFIRREQEAYREYLQTHSGLRASVEARVRELLTVEAVDLPRPDRRGGLLYLKREAKQEQKAIYHRNEDGVETLLLSREALGRDTDTSLAILQVSSNGRYLAFALRAGGEDVQEIGIYDLELRNLLPDYIPRGFFRGLVFDDEGTGFYYVQEEADGRFQSRRAVRLHVFGQDHRIDREVFCGGYGPSCRLIVQGAEDGTSLGYLIVSLESEPRTRFLIHEFPLTRAPEPIIDLFGTSFGVRFSDHGIEALTTYAAPLGRIVSISPGQPDPGAWVDIIPQVDFRLYAYERWGDAIVAHYLDGPRTVTRVYSGHGELLREMHYPDSGTSTVGVVDTTRGQLFYAHSDITVPPAIYEMNLTTGESVPWWYRMESRKQVEPEIEEHVCASRDGAKIPITLVHPKGCSGVCPALLSAYGAGGVINTPKFSVLLTVLIEAGFSCATAHVRGGGEGGEQWHLAALKERKQTSVEDLIAAAEWLIENKYTTPHHLGVAGQSNGALLTLCAMTQRPELFRAAMTLGPIADLTRFHLFGVARGFVAELGSPEDPEEFAALYRLSPYHCVRQDQRYPAVLIISGDRDKRCDALHARKMIAQLHDSPRQEYPVLLDYTEQRGHKPVLPLAERIRSLSNRLTFLIAELSSQPTRELVS
jgi:prolyl oligopeptidase